MVVQVDALAPLVMARDKIPMLDDATDEELFALPTDEEFFAVGTDNTCEANCTQLMCCDIRRLFCKPSPCCQPQSNMSCCFLYNMCAGASVGLFIWPLGNPCDCCTFCCPFKAWSFICCCCASPESRCDSCRFIGQRVLYTGMVNTDLLYPMTNGRKPVSEHVRSQHACCRAARPPALPPHSHLT